MWVIVIRLQQNNWSNVYANNYQPVIKGTNVQGKCYAQCKRYGIKRCIVLAGKYGIKVVVKGKGKIINQSIPPGTPLTKGNYSACGTGMN